MRILALRDDASSTAEEDPFFVLLSRAGGEIVPLSVQGTLWDRILFAWRTRKEEGVFCAIGPRSHWTLPLLCALSSPCPVVWMPAALPLRLIDRVLASLSANASSIVVIEEKEAANLFARGAWVPSGKILVLSPDQKEGGLLSLLATRLGFADAL